MDGWMNNTDGKNKVHKIQNKLPTKKSPFLKTSCLRT